MVDCKSGCKTIGVEYALSLIQCELCFKSPFPIRPVLTMHQEQLTQQNFPCRHVYIHVPFCRHRCGYCDFTLVAGRDDLVDEYFSALSKELQRVEGRPILDTLFFGGGTPSHLGPHGIRQLVEIIHNHFCLGSDVEFTIEANPLDVTQQFVAAVVEAGITRVSLGSQSLNPRTLESLDRDHSPDDIVTAVSQLLDSGMAVSLDLMVAAPGQKLVEVENDLIGIEQLNVQHVSVYCLTWEKGTAFESARRRGELLPMEEDMERRMFEKTIERLKSAGYEHYEISNFAQPGYRCRHNEAYWKCQPWEAFGPGAARFDGRVRKTNHRSTTTWIRKVLAGEDSTMEVDSMTAEEAARERIVVGLRRRDGIERRAFTSATGFEMDALAGKVIRQWVKAGLAEDNGSDIRLTHEGMILSDTMWPDIL